MVDLKIWAQALDRMPKLSHAEWQQLDPVARWLIACRASVLFMTFTAAALGGLLAWRAGAFQLDLWLATVIGLVFAHATNNLLNDYTDSRRGIDRDNYYRNQYGVHVLEDGLMSGPDFWRYVGVTAGIALLLGGWLVVQRSGLTLDLMLAGAFFVLFYTWPLKYYGLGEPAVLLVWGPLMVGGTYYVLVGQWSWDVTWLSLVFALGPTTVIFGKHTDKLEADRAKGVHTLPVMIGERAARASIAAMLIAQYLLCVGLVIAGRFQWPLLLALGGLAMAPDLLRALRQPKPAAPPADYAADVWPLWFSAWAFRHTRRFTSFFLIGLILDTILA
ncbi:prenyltransferase [Mangrovimicrobium sediminis]|uniref:Prenyltransferase n=1 Tax=Mangrovimicrobium sediminis TaxID=2562682 RepID=A0A4Z0M4E6_9GAMM|nr:prenyltransferase [Haliea sp. SAOS-164]TGD74175.1 prenyltransferase [Haliea sp. SAOS-164]